MRSQVEWAVVQKSRNGQSQCREASARGQDGECILLDGRWPVRSIQPNEPTVVYAK